MDGADKKQSGSILKICRVGADIHGMANNVNVSNSAFGKYGAFSLRNGNNAVCRLCQSNLLSQCGLSFLLRPWFTGYFAQFCIPPGEQGFGIVDNANVFKP